MALNEVYLRPVNEEDIRYIHKWWNDFDNFGATGIEKKISFETILSRYKNRSAFGHGFCHATCISLFSL